MNILIISMLLVAVAAAPTFTPDQKYDARWENYKVNFGKKYGDAAEELMRRQIWEENVINIDNHNAEFLDGKHTYKQTENFFTDMTEAEKQEYLSKPKN